MKRFVSALAFLLFWLNQMPETITINIEDPVLRTEWEDFKRKFNKTYASGSEEERRYNVYLDTKRIVDAHNQRYANGEVTFKMGINQFSDMTKEEFSNTHLGFKNVTRN